MSKIKFTLLARKRPDPGHFRSILVLRAVGAELMRVDVAIVSPLEGYKECRVIKCRGYGAIGDGAKSHLEEELNDVIAWAELPDVKDVSLDWNLGAPIEWSDTPGAKP